MNLCYVDEADVIYDELMQAKNVDSFQEGLIGLSKIVGRLQAAQKKDEEEKLNSPAAPVQQLKDSISSWMTEAMDAITLLHGKKEITDKYFNRISQRHNAVVAKLESI